MNAMLLNHTCLLSIKICIGARRRYTGKPSNIDVDYKSLSDSPEPCGGQESALTECDIPLRGSCNMKYHCVKCRPGRNFIYASFRNNLPFIANCIEKSLRLVGGASSREGRVEVCVDGRWGTVYYNEQLAGTVCSQLGFPNKGYRALLILTL